MRHSHVIAIIVVLLIGVGVKMIFFPKSAAEAQLRVPTTASMNVLQMHLDRPGMRGLPEQNIKEPF